MNQENAMEPSVALMQRKSDRRKLDVAVHLRESSADVRELAADVREGKADSREQEILDMATLQTAHGNYLLLLQQANERLIIASVEAQKMATQVKFATDQVEIAKCAAEKANLAKTSFLSNMSHELRTPLNAILGFAQLLEAGKPTPTDTQRVWLNQITTAGWYLLDLINQILDLSIIELGHVKLEYQSVSLSEILSECEGMIELQAEKLNVHVHFQPVDAALLVETDFTRLKQIILNLLSNAIKYNQPQGTVEVSCTALPQHFRINVKDSGIGLSPEMQADLFQPFNRLGQEKSAKQGTGIGLVVTKQLVELMGGVIGFTSDLGVGSDFWIELPLENTRTITEEKAEIERGQLMEQRPGSGATKAKTPKIKTPKNS